MLKKLSLLFCALLAMFSLLCACGTEAEPSQVENKPLIKENLMWNTEELFARKVNVTPGDEGNYVNAYGKTKAIFFDGEPYKGKDTTCFAYLGVPSGEAPQGGFPAIVLVHGGGGCAFYEWVEYWNGKGYVAIAIDTYGQQYGNKSYDGKGAPKNPDGGPSDSGSWTSTAADCKDSWVYHSIANIISAHNILRDMDNVNSDKIGITGISWGSVLTCIASGVDYRFNAFAPIYGGGYLFKTIGFTEKPYFHMPENLEEWIEYYDPSSYLCYNQKPMLFVMGMNDHAFSVYLNAQSANLCKGPVYYSQRKDLSHYHRWKDEEGMYCVASFMDCILQGKEMPYEITSASCKNGELTANLKNAQVIRTAMLQYTASTDKDTRKWVWSSQPVVIGENGVTAQIPANTHAAFIQFTDGNYKEVIMSTQVFFFD